MPWLWRIYGNRLRGIIARAREFLIWMMRLCLLFWRFCCQLTRLQKETLLLAVSRYERILAVLLALEFFTTYSVSAGSALCTNYMPSAVLQPPHM